MARFGGSDRSTWAVRPSASSLILTRNLTRPPPSRSALQAVRGPRLSLSRPCGACGVDKGTEIFLRSRPGGWRYGDLRRRWTLDVCCTS